MRAFFLVFLALAVLVAGRSAYRWVRLAIEVRRLVRAIDKAGKEAR